MVNLSEICDRVPQVREVMKRALRDVQGILDEEYGDRMPFDSGSLHLERLYNVELNGHGGNGSVNGSDGHHSNGGYKSP